MSENPLQLGVTCCHLLWNIHVSINRDHAAYRDNTGDGSGDCTRLLAVGAEAYILTWVAVGLVEEGRALEAAGCVSQQTDSQ